MIKAEEALRVNPDSEAAQLELAASCEATQDPAGVVLALYPLLEKSTDPSIISRYVTACISLGWLDEAEAAVRGLPSASPDLWLQIAGGWAARGQASRALPILARVEKAGIAAEGWLAGVPIYLHCRKPAKAVEWAQHGAELARGNPLGCALLARAQLAAGHPDLALAALDGCTPDPASASLLELWRGRAELRSPSTVLRQAGIKRLTRLASGGSGNAVAAFEAGQGLLSAGRTEAGVNLLSQALQEGYQPLLGYRLLSRGYAALGRKREARWAEGKAASLLHQWPTAESAFRSSVALDPTKPAAYLELARALSAQGRVKDSLQVCTSAEAAHASNLDLSLHKASLLGRLERVPEQQRVLEAAAKLEPARANEPLGNLGRLYYDSQQFDRAIATLGEALRSEEGDAFSHLYLGLAYARHSEDPAQAALAAEHLLRAALGQPEYFYPWINAGSAYRGLGYLPEAAACYRRALDGDSRWEGPYLSLAQVLQRQGRPSGRVLLMKLYARARVLEAQRQQLENRVKSHPLDAGAHLALGDRFLKDGRARDACGELLVAVALQPEMKAAQARLADACALLDFDDIREEAELAAR